GAMCVTDWKNTSRRPIASRLSPRSSGGLDAVRSIAGLLFATAPDYSPGGDHSRNLWCLAESTPAAAYTPWALPITGAGQRPQPVGRARSAPTTRLKASTLEARVQTTEPTPPPAEMLALLEPTMLRGLERHLSAATEWFPHEYVPYEVGRNYVDEPWDEADSALGIVSRTALEGNLLTEDNLPYYHLALWEIFGRGGVWGEWVRRWTAEEGRHAIVLRDYLTVTRGLDPVVLERGRMDQVSRGYYPDGDGGGRALDPLDGVVYTTLQELATRIAHRNTGTFTQDPIIEKLTARIATDENLHYVFYRDLGKAALEIAPSEMMLAINRQVTGFAMPGLDIPEFKQKAIEIAKAGIYDLRIHHDEVVLPVLFTHWKIDKVTGLSEEAEQARDGITNYLSMLDAMASHYEEKRAARTSG